MPSLHEVINSWGLPPVTVQKLEAWLENGGWNLTEPPGKGVYNLTEDYLLQAGLSTLWERRTVLEKLKAAAGKRCT